MSQPPKTDLARVLWELDEEQVDKIFGSVEVDDRERYDRGGDRGN